jgi:hypothetical protein
MGDAAAGPTTELCRNEKILEHRKTLERPWNLKATSYPGAAPRPDGIACNVVTIEANGARVRSKNSGHQIEQARLAGAICPDNAEGLALGNIEIDCICGDHRAEALRDTGKFEKHLPSL